MKMNQWDISKALQQYNIDRWADGYFDIDRQGFLVARPDGNAGTAPIPLLGLVHEIQNQGLALPLLIRFSDILQHRVEKLCAAFASVMQQQDYRSGYTPVYPIKVNQQHSVVKAIINSNHRVGLEAGSKSELLAVLALSNQNDDLIICNGNKDQEYMRLALIGRSLGYQIFIVIEKLSELRDLLKTSAQMQVQPLIGVRLRLASIGSGKWQNTGGEKAKFGLSAAQLLEVIDQLKQAEMLQALQMVHFHMGSQIANIEDIGRGVQECACYYASLCNHGASIGYFNIGGGLGIDYEGTHSRDYFSINYSFEEYARTIVGTLQTICQDQGLAQPHIISESGRALTAHHAVLITNVVDVEHIDDSDSITSQDVDHAPIIQNLLKIFHSIKEESIISAHDTAQALLGQAEQQFNKGVVDLGQRARIEQIYTAICQRLRKLMDPDDKKYHDLLEKLNEKLADKYFCNYSIFQSIPDVWAIDQIFPIVPLSQLDKEPTRRVVIEDITCDSDGRVDYYVDNGGINRSILLHAPEPGVPYLMGIFLVGAYQEILGDMHNLFGDVNSVHVKLKDNGHRISQSLRGDSTAYILRHVHYDPDDLLQRFQDKIEAKQHLSGEQKQKYLAILEEGLQGYTYLEED